jgi:DnaK suppressor protein
MGSPKSVGATVTVRSALDTAFIEKQRHHLNRLRDALMTAARSGEADEANIRTEAANSASREYEDDAQRLAMLELEGNLVSRDVVRLERVNRALEKIKEGTYGLSDVSGQPIPRERLEAIPETIFTIAEEQAREKKP